MRLFLASLFFFYTFSAVAEDVHQVFSPRAEISWLDSAVVTKEGEAWFLDVKGVLEASSADINKIKENPATVVLAMVPQLQFAASCNWQTPSYRMTVTLPSKSSWPLREQEEASFSVGGRVSFSARLRLPSQLSGFTQKLPLRLDWDGSARTVGKTLPLVLVWDQLSRNWTLHYGLLTASPENPPKDEIRIERYGVPVDSLDITEEKILESNAKELIFRIAGTYVQRSCQGESVPGVLAIQRNGSREELGLLSLHQGKDLDPWRVGCQSAYAPQPITLEFPVPLSPAPTVKILTKHASKFLFFYQGASGWNMKSDKMSVCFP